MARVPPPLSLSLCLRIRAEVDEPLTFMLFQMRSPSYIYVLSKASQSIWRLFSPIVPPERKFCMFRFSLYMPRLFMNLGNERPCSRNSGQESVWMQGYQLNGAVGTQQSPNFTMWVTTDSETDKEDPLVNPLHRTCTIWSTLQKKLKSERQTRQKSIFRDNPKIKK